MDHSLILEWIWMLIAGKDHNNFISKTRPALLDGLFLRVLSGFLPQNVCLEDKCTLCATECIVVTPTWHLGITGCDRREISNAGAQGNNFGCSNDPHLTSFIQLFYLTFPWMWQDESWTTWLIFGGSSVFFLILSISLHHPSLAPSCFSPSTILGFPPTPRHKHL